MMMTMMMMMVVMTPTRSNHEKQGEMLLNFFSLGRRVGVRGLGNRGSGYEG